MPLPRSSATGFVERVGSGACYGFTTVGIVPLRDWALYFAREQFVQFARDRR